MFPDPGVAQAYRAAIQQHCGLQVSQDTVANAIRKGLSGRSSANNLRTDEAAEEEFWAALIRELCPDSAGFQACFDHLFAHFGNAENWSCFPDVAGAISEIQAHGFPCAIASNFDRRLNSVCDGLPSLAGITHRIISSVVGWRKPAPQFFAAVGQEFDLPLHEILMVGDDLNNDVLGAVAAGMSAVLICRDESVTFELPANAVRVSSLTELADLLTNPILRDINSEQSCG